MREIEPPFVIESDGATIQVSEHSVEGERLFHLQFPDKRKSLNLVVAKMPGGKKWWTSVPQGRQQEAEKFGRLIANFIRSKRKA